MGITFHCVYPIYYTRCRPKRKPLFSASGKKREKSRAAPARLWGTSRYFWKVTPTTATLTQATLSPLVFSTALNTASCTARATSVTT